MTKKTVRDIDLQNKRVLLRADYNVPVQNGVITDDFRIRQSLPTVDYILSQPGTSLVLISHLGRPEGASDQGASLEPVATTLQELLGKKVRFVASNTGEEVKQASSSMQPGDILMLENLRFNPGEENNSIEFAKAVVEATGAQVFIQDGFGVVHRAHASTDAMAKLLPSVGGLLLEKEVDTIAKIMQAPARPLITVVGGAKISDKIEILNRFIDFADCVAVGGGMANSFLAAEDVRVGKSLVEPGALESAREILQKAKKTESERPFNFMLPVDVVVSTKTDGSAPTRIVDLSSHSLADIMAYPKRPERLAVEIADDEMILDIGPVSAGYISGAIKLSNTVIWNGACGVTETKGLAGASGPFAHGTKMIVDAMIGTSRYHQNRPFSLVGGGDTVGYVEEQGLTEEFGHVSTGGGASLELMAGRNLPGIEILGDK
ncbi:phosphoglycerate kinase [Candidatus Saccharibacteria bacterium RIFCSPHIGHO2_01_FULL_48_12]|nr:MAG: phosphoglycerate kinase [Candidatus Saccharibacteria bacterium RIFCSPHIGHO2_01_FULL_48_12]